MSLLTTQLPLDKNNNVTANVSAYMPPQVDKDTIAMVRDCFRLGDMTMQKPRVEFNDMSVLQRLQFDKLSFNTYQPNNGEALGGDVASAWKSRAMRPIVRNKCMSVAAHATAKLIFPKVFAFNENNDEQKDAAAVMTDLMEWAGDKSNYRYLNLEATLTALWSPASIIYTEYGEVFRTVKREKQGKSYKTEDILDAQYSGFKSTVVPADELYIENFYTHDIQKQGWLIWRRVLPYMTLRGRYQKMYPNFKYVKPGVQVLYNDANQCFYEVYDSNMRPEMCEEVTYWNRDLDLKLCIVNGVLLSEHDAPNPRYDKLYPFASFGFELLDEGKCFYYKSLAFKMQQDANIINTLYPMVIDGTYLNLMPPMINRGGETISSDVIVPGSVTTFSSPDANLTPIQTSVNLGTGLAALSQVENSVNESSQSQPIFGQQAKNQTAYEISKREQEASTLLGLFIEMRSKMVKDYGVLWVGDILQYLTLGEVTDITGNNKLVYKTFLLPESGAKKTKSRKITFDIELPDQATKEQSLDESYKTLEMSGGMSSKTELFRVNPVLFRKLAFVLSVTPDVMNPMSEELERAFKLEEYDRAIANPLADQENVYRDFLLGAFPLSAKDPDKYVKKPEAQLPTAAPGIGPQGSQGNMSQTPQIPTAEQVKKQLIPTL